MATTETTTTSAEQKLTLAQRLIADAPVFWKIVQFIAGVLLAILALVLQYNLLPGVSKTIIDSIGAFLTGIWGISNFAAKTPITQSTFSIEGIQDYFNKWMAEAKDAQTQFKAPFDPANTPKANDLDNELQSIQGDLNTSQQDLYQQALKQYPDKITPTA